MRYPTSTEIENINYERKIPAYCRSRKFWRHLTCDSVKIKSKFLKSSFFDLVRVSLRIEFSNRTKKCMFVLSSFIRYIVNYYCGKIMN